MYRQNPALGLNELPIQPKVTDPPAMSAAQSPDASKLNIVDVPARDIVSFDVERSDDNVANYYWVAAPTFSLNSDVLQRQMGYSSEERKTVDQSQYENSASKLYGTRLMWLETKLGGPGVTNVKSGLTEAEHEKRLVPVFRL